MSVTPTTNLLINKFTQSGAIALTTVFTPPAPCLDPTLYPTAPSWAIFSSSCAPYPNSAWFNYQRAASSWYSPGVCPHSYEYVATSIQQLEGGGRITLAVCCPAGVESWNGPAEWKCSHTISAPDSTGFWSPLFAASASAEVVGRTLMRAPVSVAWQESDLPRFTPYAAPVSDLVRLGVITTSTSSTNTNPADTSPTNPESNNGGQTQSQGHGSGLSTGAAAGIGVGVALGTIAVVLALWCILRRYKVNFTKRERTEEPERLSYQENMKNGYSGTVVKVAEAPGYSEAAEADSRAHRLELPGDQVGWEAGSGLRSPH